VSAVTDRLDLQYVLYPSSFAVTWDPWLRTADVVQLHITHGSYFSHTALPLISRRLPVVWVQHDMWAFTGHVGYSYDCERWRFGCGSCPYLDEYPPLRHDTSAFLWRVKRAAYRRSRLTLVAPSRWLARLTAESPLLGGFPVHHIPYGVDTERYQPRDRAFARRELGLAEDRPVVLYAAARLDDRRKGAALLREAVGHLADVDFEFVVLGETAPDLDRPVRALGWLDDEGRIALAYAAADVYVLPTLADNLPNSLLEAAAAGVPSVSFDVGGVSDVLRHRETGYLAREADAEDLARGLRELLADADLRARLGAAARDLAVREFPLELQVRRYEQLYEEVLAA